MAAPDLVLAALYPKRLQRHPLYRGHPAGPALLLSAPTRHRPVLRLQCTPLQARLWEFFATPNDVAAAVHQLGREDAELGPWDVVRAITELERQGALVPVRAWGATGLPWPAWRDRT